MFTPFVFLWEDKKGNRKWEAVENDCTKDFLRILLEDGVSPATVMCAYNPILFHYVFEEYHKLTDVNFGRINEEIYGCEPHTKRKVVKLTPKPEKETSKFGWIAPDGRFFGCEYGGHYHLARKIVGEIENVFDPERHLEDLGWAKILSGSINRTRYTVGMGLYKKLTDAQLKTLTSMGLDTAYGVSSLL